jgi:hypothetical protein
MLILNKGALEAAAMAGRKPLEEMLNDHGAGSSDDLKGLDILLVDDSWSLEMPSSSSLVLRCERVRPSARLLPRPSVCSLSTYRT